MNQISNSMTNTLGSICLLAFMFCIAPQSGAAQDMSSAAEARAGELHLVAAITTDPDWLKEWQAPKGEHPQLKTTSIVARGETLTLLIVFSGAQVQGGRGSIDCAITIFPPNGADPIGVDRTPCFFDEIPKRSDYRLTTLLPNITIPLDSPLGPFRASVTIWDTLSTEEISVEVGVEIE